jgi:hypothetical protein
VQFLVDATVDCSLVKHVMLVSSGGVGTLEYMAPELLSVSRTR